MKPLTNTPINTLNLIKKEKITKIKFKSWENNVEVITFSKSQVAAKDLSSARNFDIIITFTVNFGAKLKSMKVNAVQCLRSEERPKWHTNSQ